MVTETEQTALRVRSARGEDREFVLAAAARLGDGFSPPEWRTASEIAEGERRTLRAFFESNDPTCRLLVAEKSNGALAGFIFLETVTDYFLAEPHGHIGMLVVAAGEENSGVATALMAAAEEWARENAFDRLTLNVFDTNRRARAVYEHRGYRAETLKYVKLIERSSAE